MVLMMTLTVCAAAHGQTYVWWEAESPASTNFPAHSYFSPQNDRERDAYSAGACLSRDHAGASSARYTVQVPKAGAYELWTRTVNGRTPFSWRFDQGPWQGPGAVNSPVDSIVVSCQNDSTGGRYFGLAWAHLGSVTLSAGSHTFELKIAPDATAGVAIDCFNLVQGYWRPFGRMKPGEKYDHAPAGWFTFQPDQDAFAASPIDLSRLNDGAAGSEGRIVRKGEDLAFAKTGKKVRFWGVTAGSKDWMTSHKDMDYLARRLAKMGVNMVRFHCAPYYETTPGPQTDAIHYFEAALKRNGIYCGFNWYCLAVARVQPSWHLDGFKTGDSPMELHLFYPPMQKIYKEWAANLFGSKNPYTGMSLAEDPAVSYIELIDEDNYLFWTFRPQNINPVALPYLERAWGAWCKAKYGSIDKALAAWGPAKYPKMPDHPEEGRLALYYIGDLTGQDWAAAARNPQRASDQLQFLVEDMRKFYTGMKTWLHDKVGYDGLVLATNWKTADDRVLGPLDQYADMSVDLTARNTYFNGPFKRTKFFPWSVGDYYQDLSLLRNPEQAITLQMQYTGYPFFITEGGWAMPNRFRTEGPLVMASYASLQGIDGIFTFALDPEWCRTLSPWPIQSPDTMGQYPATALIYREGYVKEGPIAVKDALKLSDLYRFKGGAMAQPFAVDVGRMGEVPEDVKPQPVDQVSSFDPLSFYVGRVQQSIGTDPGQSEVLPGLNGFINRGRKTVHSATGELALNYGAGVLTTNAPRAQGATGFLGAAGPVQLKDVTIDMKDPYGAAVLVSLDGAPLATSGRMLLQVMTEEKNRNYQTEPAKVKFSKNGPEVEARKMTDLGTAPLVVRDIEGTVSLKRPDAAQLKVTALDFNGYPAGAAGTADHIELKPSTLYYVIER